MSKMTRRHFVQSATGAALGNAVAGPAPSGSRVIVSTLAPHDWRPDGDLEKMPWSAAAPVQFDQDAFSETRYADLKTKVASCWTAQFLYLAYWCPYRELTVYQGEDAAIERWRLWERDVVEAFVNPAPQSPSHYYEFEVAPNNQWVDLEIDLDKSTHNAGWNSGFEHATRIDTAARIWTAEMRIPVASMEAKGIRPGVEWRINFYRCEGAGDSRQMLSWGRLPVRGSGASFHQPDSFGALRFGRN